MNKSQAKSLKLLAVYGWILSLGWLIVLGGIGFSNRFPAAVNWLNAHNDLAGDSIVACLLVVTLSVIAFGVGVLNEGRP